MRNVIDILSKYQGYLMALAIFISLCAVSITIIDGQIKLNLMNYPILMFLLVVVSILIALVYISIDKRKIDNLSNQIKSQSDLGDNKPESMLSELTSRQREVYDLILLGKSNKEIMSALFIEQSTLKTHINHIYKKLNIKSRRELKASIKG